MSIQIPLTFKRLITSLTVETPKQKLIFQHRINIGMIPRSTPNVTRRKHLFGYGVTRH